MSNTSKFETLNPSRKAGEEIQPAQPLDEFNAAKLVFLAAVERARDILAAEAAADLSTPKRHRREGRAKADVTTAKTETGGSLPPGTKSLRRKLSEP